MLQRRLLRCLATDRPARLERLLTRCNQWLIGAFSLLMFVEFATADTPVRPNIILVMPDDQGYPDVGIHGNPVLKTPHLDAFAKESVRLTDFHVSPTCAPTRSALMTGRHEFRNGVTHTILERERMTLAAVTLPQVLKSAGYTTGIFGKWHLGDEDDYQPGRRGFDEVYIHGAGGIGQTYPGSCGDAPKNSYFGPVIRHNGKFEKTTGYCTDEFFREAMQWMATVPKDQPFFCYITPNAPHSPLDCPAEYVDRYAGKVPDDVARFYGMITNIDENFGRLLAHLKNSGREQSTIVIFMTDNGSATGHKFFNAGLRAAKGSPYEGGIRVPSFWRWPGHWPVAERGQLTCHMDILPTFMDLLNISPSVQLKQQIEGRSLLPVLTKGDAAWPDRYLMTHLGRWDNRIDPRKQPEIAKYARCSIRWRDWTLVSNVKQGPPQWELYHLGTDPSQKVNVAAQESAIVEQLAAEYDTWWTSVLPGMVNEEAPLADVNPYHAAYWQQYQGPGPNEAPRLDRRQ